MKNGFTLVELIMVILLLGIIALVTVPAVNTVIKNSKLDTYENQVKTIEETAKTYMAKHSTELPSKNDPAYCVTVKQLQKEGLLSKDDIINPNYKEGGSEKFEQNETLNGSVKVIWKNNNYVYSYYENESCTED